MEEDDTDIQLEARATAGSTIGWEIERAADDNPTIGGPGDLPTLTPDPNNSHRAELTLDENGSFIVRAFCDDDGDGVFTPGEDVRTLKIVMVRARLNRDNSTVNQRVVRTDFIGQGVNREVRVRYGVFTNRRNAAIDLDARVNIVGGGSNGRRGIHLSQVRGGWLNNGTGLNVRANYTAGHVVSGVFVSNRGRATGPFQKYFVLGGPPANPNPAPQALAPPVLDTGRNPAGNGGASGTFNGNRITRRNRPLGRELRFRAFDSPSIPVLVDHPGFANSRIRNYRCRIRFHIFIVLWTTRNPQTYVVVRDFNWTCDGRWNITFAPDTITAAGLGPPNPNVTTGGAVTHAAPVRAMDDARAEVRRPRMLDVFAYNARR